MAGASNYLQNQLLNWTKGTTFAAAPAAVYVSLHNGDPTDAGTGGAEVTTTVRAAGRLAATFGAISSNTSMTNNALIDFGLSAGATTITHVGIWSAASGGNLLYSAPLSGGSQAVAAGNSVQFAAGQLSVSVD